MAVGHYRMRLDTIWRPVLLMFGGIQSNSFVDMTEEVVHFHFGFVFDRTVARSEVESVTRRSWPWWMGVGWRSNLRGVIGLIGSHEGVVEVKLRHKQRAWGIFPCDRIAVSLQEPDRFVAELSGSVAKTSVAPKPTKKTASARKPRQAPARRTTRRKSQPQ